MLLTTSVQEAFKCASNHQVVQGVDEGSRDTTSDGFSPSGSSGSQEVSALLAAHATGGLSEVLGTVPAIPHPQQFDPPLQNSNIVNAQGQD